MQHGPRIRSRTPRRSATTIPRKRLIVGGSGSDSAGGKQEAGKAKQEPGGVVGACLLVVQGRSEGVGGRRARSCVKGGRRVMSPVVAPSSGGCCGTRGTGSTGKGTRMQAERPQGVPFRTSHPLGVVVNRPSLWPDR
jgi:hypothetical protein